MLEALIAGQRDPHTLADLARGRLKIKRAVLVEALTGRFEAHHAELARILLDQIDTLTAQINTLTRKIEHHWATLPIPSPAAEAPASDQTPPTGGQPSPVARLDEIPGTSAETAQVILAEIGPDMTRCPTAGHLVSWAKLCPRTCPG